MVQEKKILLKCAKTFLKFTKISGGQGASH